MDNAIEKSTAAQYDKLIFEKSGTPSHLLCCKSPQSLMTALFPPYHTPLSVSNGANLLCAIVLGG